MKISLTRWHHGEKRTTHKLLAAMPNGFGWQQSNGIEYAHIGLRADDGITYDLLIDAEGLHDLVEHFEKASAEFRKPTRT